MRRIEYINFQNQLATQILLNLTKKLDLNLSERWFRLFQSSVDESLYYHEITDFQIDNKDEQD